MSTKPLTEMTPAEIDGKLATIHEKEYSLNMRVGHEKTAITEISDPMSRRGKHSRDSVTGELYSWEAKFLEECRERLAKAETEREKLVEKAAPYKAEFERRGGWRRYFLVTSSDGHIHRGMHCATCYPSTTYGWLPELSGCVEEEMVAKYGMKACTVCFPEAPTMPGWAKAEKEAAAEAEKKAGTHCSYKTAVPGSVDWKMYYKRGHCPECGARSVAVTKHGDLRKHKRPTPKSV